MQVWSTKCRFSSYHPCWYKTRRAHYQNLKWEKTFFLRQHDVFSAPSEKCNELTWFLPLFWVNFHRSQRRICRECLMGCEKTQLVASQSQRWRIRHAELGWCRPLATCYLTIVIIMYPHFKKLKDNWMHKLTNCFLKPRKIETHAELNSEHTWWGEGGISNLKVTQWLSPSSHTVTIFWVFSR